MKLLFLITCVGFGLLSQCEKRSSSFVSYYNEWTTGLTTAQERKLDSLSAAEQKRIILIYVQGLEALGEVHIQGYPYEGKDYWLASTRSMILHPDERFTFEQREFIEEFNQLARRTVTTLDEYDESREHRAEESLDFIIHQFHRDVQDMMRRKPSCEYLINFSPIADAYFRKSGISDILTKAEEERKSKNLVGPALGYHFLDTASKVQDLVK